MHSLYNIADKSATHGNVSEFMLKYKNHSLYPANINFGEEAVKVKVKKIAPEKKRKEGSLTGFFVI
ncbi:hypothetical protein EWI07_03090 [Sporolactobacillus sp. THM7-4]|nr:hypothetical protein EWI07_03090 [Sporolactobacillus sp. THM7-4]